MITRRGKPVADLVPHRGDERRWLAPAEVLEIREIASADPTWPADLARLRAEDELGPLV